MFKVFSLFSGLGAFEEALKKQKIPFELIGFSEIEKHPSKAFSLLHNIPEEKNLGDITKIDEKTLEDFDLLVGGSPCQNLSNVNMKERNGLKGSKSSLFYDYVRILNAKKPKYFIFENVKRLLTSNKGEDFKIVKEEFEKHYNIYYKVLNSKFFDVSQNRERIFIIGIRKDINQTFEFPKENDYLIPLKNVVELGLPYNERYYLTEKNITSFLSKSEGWAKRFKTKDIGKEIGFCLTTTTSKQVISNNFIKDKYGTRGLTEKEMFKMQGFNPEYVDVLKENKIPYTAICKMIGNSITINVLEKIILNLLRGDNNE